jgi:hypothetical protein
MLPPPLFSALGPWQQGPNPFLLGDDEMAAAVGRIRFSCVLLCTLVAGCSHAVRISRSPAAVIHPELEKPHAIWNGERVQLD